MPTLKKGDVVSCGRKGWWKVKSSDSSRSNRLTLELVMDKKGNFPKAKPQVCHAFTNLCKLITVEDVKREKEETIARLDKLLYILNPERYPLEGIEKIITAKEVLEPDFLTNLLPPQRLSKK